MAMKERNKAIARLFWRRLSLIALSVLFVLASFAVWGVYKKENESRMLRLQAAAQLADLKEQESHLSERIDYLNTQKGKEAALREQYGVARKGEELVVIVESETPQPLPEEEGVATWVRKIVPFW